MTNLQEKEFEILKEFIKVCEQLDVKYYLVCGSALGAVKYGGFIPWDDDIDVAMPRDDYNKFVESAQKLLSDNLFLQNYKTDPAFPQLFSKIRNSNTTYIEKSVEDLDINHGIYIDIFPLDGYPENRLESMILEIRKKIYLHMLGTAFKKPPGIIRGMEYRFKRFLKLHKKTAKIVNAYSMMIKKYDTETSTLWCNHGNWQGSLEYAPKWQYGEGSIVDFEGIKVKVPEKYDLYLTQKYGDWRADLPESEKKGHHYYTVCDCNKPYLEYVKGKGNE